MAVILAELPVSIKKKGKDAGFSSDHTSDCTLCLQLRTSLDKIEEMEMTNSHLAKRLEKMKANRTALLAQQ